MTDLDTFDDPNDSIEYTDVDEVTLGFAQNGCILSFWGRYAGDYQEFKMVYPSMDVAFDFIKDLRKSNKASVMVAKR